MIFNSYVKLPEGITYGSVSKPLETPFLETPF